MSPRHRQKHRLARKLWKKSLGKHFEKKRSSPTQPTQPYESTRPNAPPTEVPRPRSGLGGGLGSSVGSLARGWENQTILEKNIKAKIANEILFGFFLEVLHKFSMVVVFFSRKVEAETPVFSFPVFVPAGGIIVGEQNPPKTTLNPGFEDAREAHDVFIGFEYPLPFPEWLRQVAQCLSEEFR